MVLLSSAKVPLGNVRNAARDPLGVLRPSLRQYRVDVALSRVNHEGLGAQPVEDATDSRLGGPDVVAVRLSVVTVPAYEAT
jgi:hypothetical protein